MASAAPSAVRSSAREGRREGGRRDTCADPVPGSASPTASGASAHSASVVRQPSGSASSGSASPLTRIAAGMPDCLIPKPDTLAVRRDLLRHVQVDRGLRDRVRHARHREQREQHRERGRERRRAERGGRDEHAAPHRAQRADVVREPPAPAGAERAREEEDRHAGGHRLDAHVEVAADLKRERADEEAGQDGRRACGDREA